MSLTEEATKSARELFNQLTIHRARQARAQRRGLGDFHFPFRRDRAVQRAEAMAREREPLRRGLDRVVVRQQRVARELVGEHHARLDALVRLEHPGQRRDGAAPVVARLQLQRLAARHHDAPGAQADAQGFLPKPRK
jgi:hypothetical protein